MPTVLIADDSPTIRGFARLALRGLPVELVEAEDGVQALLLLRESVPALALIDVNMPNLASVTGSWVLKFSELQDDERKATNQAAALDLAGP